MLRPEASSVKPAVRVEHDVSLLVAELFAPLRNTLLKDPVHIFRFSAVLIVLRELPTIQIDYVVAKSSKIGCAEPS